MSLFIAVKSIQVISDTTLKRMKKMLDGMGYPMVCGTKISKINPQTMISSLWTHPGVSKNPKDQTEDLFGEFEHA